MALARRVWARGRAACARSGACGGSGEAEDPATAGGALPARASAPERPGALRRALLYVRYELPELVNPSAMPDPPPGSPEHARLPGAPWDLPLSTHAAVWRAAARMYAQSWRSAEPAAAPPPGEAEEEDDGVRVAARMDAAESTVGSDAARAARAGRSLGVRALSELYASRVAAYKEALDVFARSYREAYRDELDADEREREERLAERRRAAGD